MKITKIEKAKKRKNRVHIYLDGEYAFSCNLNFLISNNLYKDREIDNIEYEKLEKKIFFAKTKDYVLNILSKKNYTEKEIVNKLKKRKTPDNIINEIIEYLKNIGLIDEKMFLNDYVNYLKNLNKYSKIEIKKKIFEKQFSNTDINDLLNDYDESNAIKKIISKKHIKNEKDKIKIINYLRRKGFNYDKIKENINIKEEDI